ncbi:unnamed protein product [Ascophyllum nodosum]
MGNNFSAEEVDTVDDVGDMTSLVKGDIDALKDFIANRDMEVVREATKGMGTDEASLVNTLCNRTKKQIHAIDALYHEKYETSLLSVVSEEVSGNFGKMVTYSLMETDDFGAEIFSLSTEGLGTSENVLIDLAHSHTNEELAAIKDKWETKNNESMLDCVNEELGGNARRILFIILGGEKSDSREVDYDLATEQAAALNEAWKEKQIGSDEDMFLEILGRQSRAQIQEIKAAYEREYGMTLMKAITKRCRGTYRRCLIGCLFPSVEAYTAYGLFEACDGFGTDEDRVTRLLGGTEKRNMHKVAKYFQETNGKPLVEELKDELNGTFLKAALSWAAGGDPTNGLEDITAHLKLEVEEDSSKDREYTKALLQERTNLRDFICQADAADIRHACSGLGTNDRSMVNIICSRTKVHLARVDQHYNSMFKRSLSKQVRQECGGTYRNFLLYTLLPYADFDALMLKKSMDGLGTKEDLIIATIAPLNNARIRAAKKRHDEKYEELVDRLQGELGGSFEEAVLTVLQAKRKEGVVDEELAQQQAQELIEDKDNFIPILTKASRRQIKLIGDSFEQSQEISLERAIKKEFSGDMEKLLLALAMEPMAFYAHQLKEAFDHFITDKEAVARVLGGNDKHFVRKLNQFYLDVYEESLMEALKRETSGKFRRAALMWVCSSDPEHPGNSLEEAFDGLDDDEEEEENQDQSRGISIEPDEEEDPEEEEGAEPSYGVSKYYEPPPAPRGFDVDTEAYGYSQSASVGFVHDSQMHAERPPPPPYDGEEEEEEEEDLEDDDLGDDDVEAFGEPLEGATDEQMEELRRLAKLRRQAMVSGHPHRVQRRQQKIKRLIWEIQNNA